MSKDKHADSHEEARQQLEKLVENAIQGDKDALSELCKQTARGILFRVTKIMGKNDGAEDISQEVLLRLCTGINKLKDPKTFHGWLAKIIINEKNRYLSKQIGRGDTMNIDDYVDVVTEQRAEFLPSAWAEKEDTREIISSVVSTLPMRQREAVVLHYYDNLSVSETADAMGIAIPTASQYLTLAREKLKTTLEMHPLVSRSFGLQKVSVGAMLTGALQSEGANFIQAAEAFEIAALAACNQVIFAEAAAIVAAEAATAVAAESAAVAVATTATGGAAAGTGATVGTGAAVGTAAAGASAAGGAGAASGAAAISGYVIAGVCMALACVAAIVGFLPGATPQQAQTVLVQMEFIAINSAEIVYYGGEIYEDGLAHINPERAFIHIDADGEAEVIEWWITSPGLYYPLLRGYGDEVHNALTMLRGQSPGGEYFIYFKVYAQGGVYYTISSNFFLRD